MAALPKAAIESAARCAYNRAAEKNGVPADWDTHADAATRQHFYELVGPVLEAAFPDTLYLKVKEEVEHQRRVESSAESDAIHAGADGNQAGEKEARLVAVIAKTTADRLEALLEESGGEDHG